MSGDRARECLFCGMQQRLLIPDINDRALPMANRECVKCDSTLMEQTDGSVMTVDVAHHQETVRQALTKYESALSRAWHSHAMQLRLVVGGGLIRDAVMAELNYKLSKGVVLEVSEENRGAVLVRIRNPPDTT